MFDTGPLKTSGIGDHIKKTLQSLSFLYAIASTAMAPVTELTNLFRCLDEYIKTWPFHFFQTPFGHFKIWPLAALTSHQLADSYPKRTKCFP